MCSGVTDGTVITVTVLDATVGRWQQMKRQRAERFHKLGLAGGGAVDGQHYTKQQCFIRAFEIDDRHAGAWNYLGSFCGGGDVGGQQYTQQQCYIRALEIDDQHANAWFNLGIAGGGSVGGQQYTREQCCDRAAEIRGL